MSIEVEFIVQTEAFQHVKLTLSGSDLAEARDESPAMTFEEWMGDYWASMKAGVLYGRDKALAEATSALPLEPIPPVGTFEMPTREEFEAQVDAIAAAKDIVEMTQEGVIDLLAVGLGATVLSEEEKPVEVPSGPSVEDPTDRDDATLGEAQAFAESKPKRPWDKKPAAKKAATPKAAAKTETKSDWDF